MSNFIAVTFVLVEVNKETKTIDLTKSTPLANSLMTHVPAPSEIVLLPDGKHYQVQIRRWKIKEYSPLAVASSGNKGVFDHNDAQAQVAVFVVEVPTA